MGANLGLGDYQLDTNKDLLGGGEFQGLGLSSVRSVPVDRVGCVD